jgi:hypothetical protein
MTTFNFRLHRPGPQEVQLRQRLNEMQANGWCILRYACLPGFERLTREERCAAILDALDAPACPVSEVRRSAA